MTDPTPVRAGEDAGREATPKQIAAAWAAWRVRHPTLRLGPGPGFAEAITAALNAEPSAAEAEVARLRGEMELARKNEQFTASHAEEVARHAGALRERVVRLEDALTFYADPEVYKPHPHGPAFDRRDVSYVARAALTEGAPTDV